MGLFARGADSQVRRRENAPASPCGRGAPFRGRRGFSRRKTPEKNEKNHKKGVPARGFLFCETVPLRRIRSGPERDLSLPGEAKSAEEESGGTAQKRVLHEKLGNRKMSLL